MKYEDALRYLKILKYYTDNDSAGELHKQTYDVAIAAIEKQIPKSRYYGQAIDWSDMNER